MGMADWVTISSLATAGGTLVLAFATFGSTRSANKAARLAERSLMVGLRPVLAPSRENDPPEHVAFGDGHRMTVLGHGAVADVREGRVYFLMGLRNVGQGLGVLHGWHARPQRPDETLSPPGELEEFRRLQRDIYVPAGDTGFWQGAIRELDTPGLEELCEAVESGARIMIELLYGDHEGGQRTIARFAITPDPDAEGWVAQVVRYWNVDGDDPR
jgi:hypothetical protein